MKELLGIYILLPTVYFMYRSGALVKEKSRNPVIWRTITFFGVFTTGILAGILSICSAILLIEISSKTALVSLGIFSFLFGSLISGYFLLFWLKRSRPGHNAARNRVYQKYSMADAVLFPRVIPRGGFLWRSIAFRIFNIIIQLPFVLFFSYALERLYSLPVYQIILSIILLLYCAAGILCYFFWYYIAYICIPRIRDAGLSRDTLVLLFIPGLSFVALFMLLLKPTNLSGHSSA
jgi:hypothetical protein